MRVMVGGRIRELRQSQGRSLADVAGKASISVATLSRIENDKQSVDLAIFLTLARVLEVSAASLLQDDNERESRGNPLAHQISTLETRKRAELWRELAAARRTSKRPRASSASEISNQVEELLAQMDFLREELETVRKRIKQRT